MNEHCLLLSRLLVVCIYTLPATAMRFTLTWSPCAIAYDIGILLRCRAYLRSSIAWICWIINVLACTPDWFPIGLRKECLAICHQQCCLSRLDWQNWNHLYLCRRLRPCSSILVPRRSKVNDSNFLSKPYQLRLVHSRARKQLNLASFLDDPRDSFQRWFCTIPCLTY